MGQLKVVKTSDGAVDDVRDSLFFRHFNKYFLESVIKMSSKFKHLKGSMVPAESS